MSERNEELRQEDFTIAGKTPEPSGQPHAHSEDCQCESCAARREKDFLAESSGKFADTLSDVSHSLRQTASDMESRHHPLFSKYAQSAAQSMEQFSDSLRHRDVGFFVHRAEGLARHQPGVFLGSAFTMGFALGRFLKGKADAGMSPAAGRLFRERKDDMAAISSEGMNDPQAWH